MNYSDFSGIGVTVVGSTKAPDFEKNLLLGLCTRSTSIFQPKTLEVFLLGLYSSTTSCSASPCLFLLI